MPPAVLVMVTESRGNDNQVLGALRGSGADWREQRDRGPEIRTRRGQRKNWLYALHGSKWDELAM